MVLPYINMNLPWVYTCFPSWTSPSHLPPHTIPLGHPSAPAPSILYPASNLDWRLVSHMILYMFQCLSPKSSHPRPLPQSPKDCSIHLCLFCYLTYRVIVTIFVNSIYMHSLSGFSVHGIFQATVLEWVAIFFSRGSFQPRDQTRVSCIAGRWFYPLSYQGSYMH